MPDVSTRSSAVDTMAPDWELSAALLGGTRAMRAAGEKYLPKWPAEEDKAYECRKATATLFPAYKRTVETLTGKPFSKPLKYSEDMPEQMQEWLANVDLQGRNLHSFCADLLETALGPGLTGILVDYPRTQNIKTRAEEISAGVRPYMVQIEPQQILGWRTEVLNGQTVLMQFRFMECVKEQDGPYAEKEVEQVRVLEPGRWETHRKNKDGVWYMHDEGVTSLKVIPFMPVYGDRRGFMISRSPLIEVANLNVEHWQSKSDQQTILHVARVPILAVIGLNDDDKFELKVGASAAVKLPIGAELKFVEHSGAAIEAGQNSLDHLEEQMRQAGAELLVIKPGAVTATQVSTENAVGMCALNRVVNDLQDAVNAAIDLMGTWVGQSDNGTCAIYNDFAAASLAEASAELLLKSNAAGTLSKETYFAELKRRGIVAADVAWNDEQERIDAEGPALGAMSDLGNVNGQ